MLVFFLISVPAFLLPACLPFSPCQAKDVLVRCAGTALNSKLISSQKDLFAPMVVEAVSNLDQQLLALSLVSPVRWSGVGSKAWLTCALMIFS